jgi:hypothetical protein
MAAKGRLHGVIAMGAALDFPEGASSSGGFVK